MRFTFCIGLPDSACVGTDAMDLQFADMDDSSDGETDQAECIRQECTPLPPCLGSELQTLRPRLRSQHFDELGNVPQKNIVFGSGAEPTPSVVPKSNSIEDTGSKFENCVKLASPELGRETHEQPHETNAALRSRCRRLEAEVELLKRQLERSQRLTAADDPLGCNLGPPSS